MKPATALLAALCASSALAASFGFDIGQNVLSGTGDFGALLEEVPGENPLEFCEDTGDYLLDIKSVDLDPNPPKAGTTLAIEATGDVFEEIEEGAYVFIEVKYGLIKILSLKEDLCEQMKNVDKECPLKEGEQKLVKEVELPERIPPGTYSVKADVYTRDDRKITCLQSKIKFD